MNARQSSRLLSLVLFTALCALLMHWVLTLPSLRSLGAPREVRVVQTDALKTGAAVTLSGGGLQNGPHDVQIMGVVADLAGGSGTAIVSMDSDVPQAVRAGRSLSSSIKLVGIKARLVVIECSGARQEVPLPASAVAGVSPASRNMPAMSLFPTGAVVLLSTPVVPPASSVVNNPASTTMPGAMLSIAPMQINTRDEPASQGGDIISPHHRATAAACKGDTPQPDVDQQAHHAWCGSPYTGGRILQRASSG